MVLPSNADPGRRAYSRMHSLIKQGWSRQYIEFVYPELIALARKFERETRKARRPKVKPVSLKHIHAMPWGEVVKHATVYSKWRLNPMLSLPPGEREVALEFDTYRRRVNVEDRKKRLLHPDVNPVSLGYDPRKREWPSGAIKMPDTYFPKPGLRNTHRKWVKR